MLRSKSTIVNSPYVFATVLSNEEARISREQQGFLSNPVEAVNRFLRSASGRLLLAKFVTVVSDGLDKENEEEVLQDQMTSATSGANSGIAPSPSRLSSSLAAYPSFLSMAEKFGAAENLITELLDGHANQLQVQLCLGASTEIAQERHEQFSSFVSPHQIGADKSWRSSFVTPTVSLVTRWAQTLTANGLSRLSPSQLSFLRFSIFITLIFEFAHVLLPFAVMFHKKLSFIDLYEQGPGVWLTQKRPSLDPTPARMGFYLKTAGRESGDVLLHLWLGAPLRPYLCSNPTENHITVFLPFGTNPQRGKLLWPTLEASTWWLQFDEFFASGGRNSVVKHPVSSELKQSHHNERDTRSWYQSLLCCCSIQNNTDDESLKLDYQEIDVFADMRQLMPDYARRKIVLWQELTDEQPEYGRGSDEAKQLGDCEPLLENASPVKTWPPRSPRRDNRYAKKSSVSIPTLPAFEETEEEVV